MTPPIDHILPSDGRCPALPLRAILPPGARRGAVVLQEALGRQPEIDRVVDRLGAAGYAAVAPDLFATGSWVGCLRELLRSTATGEGPMAQQVSRARQWLSDETAILPSGVALLGFCVTGGFALAVGRGWGAVSTNYGSVPPAEIVRGIAPVIGCYGGRDRFFRRSPERLRRTLDELGAVGEVHVFPTAGHSLLTDGEHPWLAGISQAVMHIKYDASVAEDAWSRIFAFFDQHLC